MVAVGVLHVDLNKKAVKLRFGQRIGAFLFNRVLRGKNVERRVERARLAPATVTTFSCIACSKADCVRGDARLISSAISNWQKIGP